MVEITLEFSDEEYRLLKKLSSKHTITIEEFAKTTALDAIENDEKFQEFRILQAKQNIHNENLFSAEAVWEELDWQ